MGLIRWLGRFILYVLTPLLYFYALWYYHRNEPSRWFSWLAGAIAAIVLMYIGRKSAQVARRRWSIGISRLIGILAILAVLYSTKELFGQLIPVDKGVLFGFYIGLAIANLVGMGDWLPGSKRSSYS